MAIRAGDVIFVANDTVLIDRLQTAGPGSVNVRRDPIYEVGNYKSTGQVAGIPDLSFSMESLDVSCEMEAFLLDAVVGTTHSYDPSTAALIDLKSAFKPGKNASSPYNTVESVGIPCLRLESLSYRYGVGAANATQSATLRGDSLYYNEGSTYTQAATGSGSSGQTVVTTNSAYEVIEAGVSRRTLAVTANGVRLNFGVDYTETYGSVVANAAVTTVHFTNTIPSGAKIRVMYASPTVETFPQSVHALVSGSSGTLSASASSGDSSISVTGFTPVQGQSLILDDTSGSAVTEVVYAASVTGSGPWTVTLGANLVNAHSSAAPVAVYVPTVKPAAIRGRDIDVFISAYSGQTSFTPATATTARTGARRISVQSTQVDWRVQLDFDEEFGNYHYVAVDFDVPQVSGSIQFKPRDPRELLNLMQVLSGTTEGSTKSANPVDSPLLDVQIALKNPVNGRVIKRLWIPDARFSLPGYQARVQQKLDFTSAFQSDQGSLYVLDA